MKKPSSLSALVKNPFLLTIFLTLLAGTVSLAQHASFTADVTSGCFPLTVKFTDTTPGAISSWAWNFGNSNSSVQQNPSAIYSAPGTYTVSLMVNGSATGTEVKTGYITVHDLPSVDFSLDKTTGCTPLVVKFTDESTAGSGAITDWLWVFGDGGTSTASNPVYTFTTPGDRTISLKVTNEFGCKQTVAKSSAISVSGPDAKFTPSSTSVCQVPSTIQFTNESTGNGNLTYTWNFGDGTPGSTAEDASHTYAQPGAYTVLLKARDQQGCEGSRSVIITAGSEDGLSFEASSYKVCEGQVINFTSQADSPVLSRNWDFGNNTSSSIENPSVAFSEGKTYQVTLTALLLGNTCESVVTKAIDVVALPKPSFTYKSDCNYKVTFTNTSLQASRVEWYIEGVLVSTQQTFSRQFAFSGEHGVTLIAYNSLGCSVSLDDERISIPFKPFASFLPNLEQDCVEPSLSGCAPFTVQFTNQSVSASAFTSLWEFGDGTTSALKEPTHTYTSKGTFTLKLTVTDVQGCKGSVSSRVTVADVTPVAKFVFDKDKVCTREEVTFTDQSENVTSWCWDFGDGSTYSGKDPRHSYTVPGVYTVSLIARNAGCQSTLVKLNAIEVKDPYIDFAVLKNCSDPYTIGIQNLSANYHSLSWDFGDGTTSTTQETSHQFPSTGNYTIKLSGSNTTTGCTTGMSIPVFIQDIKADFEIDNAKPCKEAPVAFTDKSAFAVQWEWYFGNGDISTGQNSSTSFDDPGTYHVVLTAHDLDGCIDQKTLIIDVLDIQGDFTFNATSTCDEFTAQFTDLSTATPAISGWQWDFGDGHTSPDENPQHIYQTTGTYPVKLTLTNSEGNCTFIKDGAVVFTNPVPEFVASKQGACIKEKITLTNLSTFASSFQWNFGDGRTTSGIHEQVEYPATGNYTVTLSATDQYGCTKSLSKTAFISITKPVADFAAFETSSECPPLTSIFQDKSTGNVNQWHWSFGNGQFSVLQNPAYTYLTPGSFDVQLKVTDTNGCSDTTVVEKLITIGGPYGVFSSGVPGNACINQTVPFSAITTNAAIHRWDYGDGTVEDMGLQTEVDHTYTSRGAYTASLVLIDDKGCTVVAEGDVKVVVNDTTKIDFSYSPGCIFESESFVLQATADDSDMTWNWTIEGTPAGTTQQLPIAIDSAGQHHVVLRAMNQFGCTSEISHILPVHGRLTFIPNIFTPNSDGYNSFLMIRDIEKSKWDIQVYNRYGSPVYEKQGYTNDWDGGDLPSGVYYYSVINSFCRDRSYKGIISIRR